MGKVWRSAQRGDDACREEGREIDARLVEGLRRRAPEALAGLHEQYAAGIYSLAFRVVRHAPDAEDITHDVLIRAYERLPRDREVRLRPWLYRLTLNRCYDHLRASARRTPAAQERDAPSPHDPFEQSELQSLLEATLGDLTRRQRAAILLKDVHGLSLAEVAACLDLTPGSVEVLLARARGKFRASFETRSAAAGRPLPGSVAALAALPLLPVPLGLTAPPFTLPAAPVPIPPVAPLAAPVPFPPVAPLSGGPLAAATGGGIGALLGLPSSIKTAMLVAAAAASLGSAELVATRADQRPPRPEPGAAGAVSAGPVRTSAVELPAAHTSSEPSTPAASPRASAPAPSPAASASPELSPQPSPLGIVTPSASPSPAETPEVSPSTTGSPDPRASTPSPTPTASPSVVPSSSPGSDATPSPAPSSL